VLEPGQAVRDLEENWRVSLDFLTPWLEKDMRDPRRRHSSKAAISQLVKH